MLGLLTLHMFGYIGKYIKENYAFISFENVEL